MPSLPLHSAKQLYKRMRKLDGFKVLHSYESAAAMAIAHPRGGLADILFESPKHATAAIKKLDGSTIHDAKLKARRRVERIAIMAALNMARELLDSRDGEGAPAKKPKTAKAAADSGADEQVRERLRQMELSIDQALADHG